jgi:predicted GNAT family N-acyltransferase
MANEEAQPVSVVQIKDEAELMQALAIREVVFIEEQHVHMLALQGGHAIGTGRLVMLAKPPEGQGGKWAQIGRMAVLQNARRGGTGSKLLKALETEGVKRGVTGFMLHAQLIALEFYKKHGYTAVGPVFEEAGMPHLEMRKAL